MFFIIHPDVPNAPSGVRLSDIKSRSLEVSWVGQHDGNSMVLNYIVEYSNLPGSTPFYPIFPYLDLWWSLTDHNQTESLCMNCMAPSREGQVEQICGPYL